MFRFAILFFRDGQRDLGPISDGGGLAVPIGGMPRVAKEYFGRF